MEVLKRPALILLCALIFCLGLAARAQADGVELQEREIKAGLLYNFLKYTSWPEQKMSGASSIVICLYGGDPFGGYLSKTKGRTVQKRPIAIKKINSAAEMSACNMLFLSESASDNWGDIASSLKGQSILTVSDVEGFASNGGMIEFTRKDKRIQVLLNKETVEAAQLEINNRLLRLVTVVASRDKGGRAP